MGRTWALISWFPPTDKGDVGAVSRYAITASPRASGGESNPVISREIGLQGKTGSGGGGRSNSSCVEVECETHTLEVLGTETTANLTDLVPALQYDLVITAFSNGSRLRSEPSERTTFTTLPHGVFVY